MIETLKTQTDRRSFLKSFGWASVGLTAMTTGCALPPLPYREEPTSEDASFWLSIRPEGIVEIVSPRSEIGQGIATAIKQIIAEELNLDPDRIHYIHPRSDRIPDVRATVGSDSMRYFAPLIASTAAALADELDDRVYKAHGLRSGEYRLMDQQIVAADEKRYPLKPVLTPPLMLDPAMVDTAKPKSFSSPAPGRWIGQAVSAHKIKELVMASEPIFVDDIILPEMVYARLLPATPEPGLAEQPGILAVISEPDLNAVVAEDRNILDRVFENLAPEAPVMAEPDYSLEQALDVSAVSKPGTLEHSLMSDSIDREKAFHIDVTLTMPMAAHAAMEPRTAVAAFTDKNRLEIWTGTQDVTLNRKAVVQALELDEENIIIHGMKVGGGFGGKVYSGIESEAARIARKIGRPVKLQWTREDEFHRSYHRPPSTHRIRARLDETGRISDWWHAFRSGHIIFSSAFMPEWVQEATSFIADKGVARGAVLPYSVKAGMVEFEDVRIPVDTGPWRGLGATPNSWVMETAMDLLATKAKQDPLAFRLAHLKDLHPRLRSVLEEVARLSDWQNRTKAPSRAYGLACGIYKEKSFSATVADIQKRPDGSWQLNRIWSAHDCGYTVSPDTVRAQVEGNLAWGIGTVFHETLSLEEGRLSASNFDTYRWASMEDIPPMEISLIGQEHPPSGAGETAIVSATAAVTNAMLAVTGDVVRVLPVVS